MRQCVILLFRMGWTNSVQGVPAAMENIHAAKSLRPIVLEFFTDIGRVRMVRFGMECFSANVHRYKYECCKLRQTTCDSIHRASETEGVAL